MLTIKEANVQPVYDLIAILEDAKKGYFSASEKIRDEVLSILFEKLGYQRGKYSSELKNIVSRLNVPSSIDQFTLSLLHRTWMDLKTTFKFGKKETIIHACIHGEETAIKNYTKAIEQIDEQNELREILERQLSEMNCVLNTIKEYSVIPVNQ
jgi:uncharacterized protein (TIGR02284 family)